MRSGAPSRQHGTLRRYPSLFSTRRHHEVAIKPLAQNCGKCRVVCPNESRSHVCKSASRKLIRVSQLPQKYQMMLNRSRHRGMLPIGNAILFGGLLHNSGQRSIVSVAHKRAQMMDYMVVEPASKPTDERVSRRVVGRCREDVIDPIVKLAAA